MLIYQRVHTVYIYICFFSPIPNMVFFGSLGVFERKIVNRFWMFEKASGELGQWFGMSGPTQSGEMSSLTLHFLIYTHTHVV